MLEITKSGEELLKKLFDNPDITDVTEEFPDAIIAERKGDNTLILRKISPPRRSANGKMCCRQLEYRWHKEGADVHSVQGNDFTLWQAKELDLNKYLFDQVDLF